MAAWYTYQVAANLSEPECSNRDDAQSAQPVKVRSIVLDYLELAYIPLALGVVATGLTWVVWFLTTEPCTPELVKATGCSLSSLGRYINLDVFNKMVVHGGIAGGFGGIGSYVMITRERQRADAAERRALEERQAREQERQAREEERQAREQERRLGRRSARRPGRGAPGQGAGAPGQRESRTTSRDRTPASRRGQARSGRGERLVHQEAGRTGGPEPQRQPRQLRIKLTFHPATCPDSGSPGQHGRGLLIFRALWRSLRYRMLTVTRLE